MKGGSTILIRSPQYLVGTETLETLDVLRNSPRSGLNWHCPFVLPFWLQTAYRHLGCRGEPCILSVTEGTHVIGIAPFSIEGQTAFFLGNPDVCDYQDIVTGPGREAAVMSAVAAHLKDSGVRWLDLQTLRPDALALKALRHPQVQNLWSLALEAGEVTYETRLPADWNAYLLCLSTKQRHEVRRKIRRLENHGDFAYAMAAGDKNLAAASDEFLRLFHMNRADKAAFMNAAMSAYFRDLIKALAAEQMLRLYFLKLGPTPVATVLCFDHDKVRYLYNSGYDADYQVLSVGILSKVLSLQTGIEAGCRHYDFLKGAEVYKKRIGGHEVPLYRCKVSL